MIGYPGPFIQVCAVGQRTCPAYRQIGQFGFESVVFRNGCTAQLRNGESVVKRDELQRCTILTVNEAELTELKVKQWTLTP